MFCKGTKFFGLATTLVLAILTLHACAGRQSAEVERLAVLPIENLGSDAQFNWLSPAAAAVVVYDLAGAKSIFAKRVASIAAAQAMQASHVLEGYFFERDGRISIHATLEDFGKTKAVESFEIAGPVSDGLLSLTNKLARQLSGEARTFGTDNENAFRCYGEALAATDSQAVERGLEQATMADPGFAAAYVDEARLLTDTGQRDRAREVVQAAERARLDSIERADLEYIAAVSSGDASERLKGLDSLAAVMPANADVFGEIGEMQFARHQFQQAVIEYRAAAHLDPDEPQNWNGLGYALAWMGDLSGAREAMARYQRVAPEDPNVLDSQGEVSYLCGDFKAAAQYFEQAAAKNPAEYIKAAEARLMMGDRPGADAEFAKRFGSGAGGRNLGADYQMAQWRFLTGRRQAGVSVMERLATETNGDLQALALSQLSIWKLQTGDSNAAADLANRAVAQAQNPQVRGISAMCRDIASSSTGSGSKMADAMSLVLANKFREALPLLQAVYGETNPSADGQVRTLLAWAYVQTGAVDESSKLVNAYPLPLSSGEPLFASLMFPKYLFVRGTVLQREGKRDEAAKSLELYAKYGGQDQ